MLERARLRLFGQSELLLSVAGIGAWLLDAESRDLWWSDATCRIHGLPPGTRPSVKEAVAFYAPEARQPINEAVMTAIETGGDWDIELPLTRADGRHIWVRACGRAISQGDGKRLVMGTFEDVTQRRSAAEAAIRELHLRSETETLLRDVIDAIPAALTVYDRDERLVLVNNNYRDILPGAASLSAKGEQLEDIVRRKVEAGHYAPEIPSDAAQEEREIWIADYLARHRSAEYSRVFELHNGHFVQVSNARSTSGNIVTLRTDITPIMRAEAELRMLAEHCSLTGLYNRGVLLGALTPAARAGNGPSGGASGSGSGSGGSLILFDIDFFKTVNDGLGHAAGDLLLRLVARRLQRLAEPGMTIARLGGDEFAIIAPGLTEGARLTRFVERLLEMQRRPVRLHHARYTPSISIGVTIYRPDSTSAETLLSQADAALYEAKRQGRACHALHDGALAARMERRARLADRLRIAIPQDRLAVALQPQLDLASGQISGFEALARWHDAGEWVPPQEFVGIAEDIGLAHSLGLSIIDKALAAHARLRARRLSPGMIAVNVSTAQLLADDFLDTLRQALHRHGMQPQDLEIEITETVLLDRSVNRIAHTLDTLRDRGVSLSLDDFGTGYASLSHITAFPVDRIKIDKSFTQGIISSGERGLIARSIIGLGRGLGLSVVAEGVETERQKSFLKAHGCTTIQGYLLAPPMLPDAVEAWLAARTISAQAAPPASAPVSGPPSKAHAPSQAP
jgi:diguanylate cyclase (GGDEF)-like protein/PAS domain S-box-containing protein